MRVPETAERSNQSILKEVNPEIHWKYCGAALILWPSDMKSRLTGKDPDAGKDCRQKEKGAAEGEMVGWPHRLSKLWEIVRDRGAWWAAIHGVAKSDMT